MNAPGAGPHRIASGLAQEQAVHAPVGLGHALEAALRHVREGDGRPLLLEGPRGVGKSTCARALATSLGRPIRVFDVAVAGLRLGQRDGLRELPLVPRSRSSSAAASSAAPVIVIEHADRLPGGLTGSLMAALVGIARERPPRALEHYFGVESDAGDVLFIFTTRVPASPALDCGVFLLQLLGYSLSEKVAIAARSFDAVGRHLPSALLEQLIRRHARGPGVEPLIALVDNARELTEHEMVFERLSAVAGDAAPSTLARYVAPLPGQAITLGWGPDGGVPFVIEVGFGRTSDGDVEVFGKGGEATDGAARIALHAVNAMLDGAQRLGSATGRPVLMNFPNSWKSVGAAAGLAMGLALYGLATRRSLRPALAVTGELTLGGLVLPVASCAARVLAAEAEEIDRLIVPEGNRGALREVAAKVRPGLDIAYVSSFSEAIAMSFN